MLAKRSSFGLQIDVIEQFKLKKRLIGTIRKILALARHSRRMAALPVNVTLVKNELTGSQVIDV